MLALALALMKMKMFEGLAFGIWQAQLRRVLLRITCCQVASRGCTVRYLRLVRVR